MWVITSNLIKLPSTYVHPPQYVMFGKVSVWPALSRPHPHVACCVMLTVTNGEVSPLSRERDLVFLFGETCVLNHSQLAL